MADADGPPGDEALVSEPSDPSFVSPVVEPGTVHVFLGPELTRIVLAGEIDADLGTVLHEATAAAERARPEVEAFKDEVARPQDADQQEPDGLQGGHLRWLRGLST